MLGRNEAVSYSAESCQAYCIGLEIIEKCKCIDVEFSHNLFLSYVNETLPYCYSPNATITQAINTMKCAADTAEKQTKPCSDMCEPPCEQDSYYTVASTAKWPRRIMYRNFYNSLIADKPYASQFSLLGKDCSENQCTAQELMEMDYLVSDHFTKVYIYLSSTSHTKLVDTPKLSIPALLAQLGGALNLWSGITVIVLVELLDFIFKIFITSNSKKNGEQTGDHHNTNGTKLDGNVNQIYKSNGDNSVDPENMSSFGKYVKAEHAF